MGQVGKAWMTNGHQHWPPTLEGWQQVMGSGGTPEQESPWGGGGHVSIATDCDLRET